MSRYIYCCDWGTSSLRVRLVSIDPFEIVDTEKGNAGIGHLFSLWINHLKNNPNADQVGFYLSKLAPYVDRLNKRNPEIPKIEKVIISGMASSNIGVLELQYAELPFSLNGTNAEYTVIQPIADFNYTTVLLSGVKDGTEVMRGEETQLVGLAKLLEVNANQELLMLLPGTHSKHLYISQGQLTKIETYITGELFGILSNNGLLKEAVETHDHQERLHDWPAFQQGIEHTADNNLLNSLFKVRTNLLFNQLTKLQNSDYLSGVLIGTEIRALPQKENFRIVLCAEANLYEYYKKAILFLGLGESIQYCEPEIMEQAVVMGQISIAGTLFKSD